MQTLTDSDLVERILDGDSSALATLYDRYADRIHTMCAHLLRDADEAADVTAEVFLTAAERLGQLRDPAKLRPWLYAIARNEVYRRGRHRRRVTPVAEIEPPVVDLRGAVHDGDDGDDLPDPSDPPRAAGTEDEVGSGADPAALAALLQEGAAGLDDRDRMVLELHLTQGLDGQELADALGVSVEHGYQLVHRMKDRLERSMAALLVVQGGRELCDGLDEVGRRWDGSWSVLWRKRFARHLDRCDRCARMRSRLPRAVLAGTALATAAQTAVLAAPVAARERFLAEAPARLGHPRGRPWPGEGFPPRSRRRWPWAAGAMVLVLLLGAGTLVVDADPEVVRAEPPPSTSTTVPPSTTTTVDGGTVPPVGEELTELVEEEERAVATTTTTVPRATTTASLPPPPPPTTTTTTTTTTAVPSPPTISLSSPSCTNWGSSGTFTATVSAPAGVSSVTMSWSSSTTSGSGAMTGGGSTWTRSVAVASPMTSVSATATVTDGQGRSASASRTMSAGPACSG